MKLIHHGAGNGVTGSCHQLFIDNKESLLVDCGLFQGTELKEHGGTSSNYKIEFPLNDIKTLLITHCHIDHVGRIPALLASGYQGPIFASRATAHLLPEVLEDALKVGITRKKSLITAVLNRLKTQLIAINYNEWFPLPYQNATVKARFKPAGHIIGSAYIEIKIDQKIIVFSGDLGAPYAPLLPAPKSPYRADLLVLESTYGDHLHQGRKQRRQILKKVIEKSLKDGGATLIPAFSIGRTQELLYEFEQILHQFKHLPQWQDINIILDSPMAAKFTKEYRQLKELWDNEAKQKVQSGRHPLDFKQLYIVDSHQEHQTLINRLKQRNDPVIVIAASGMCTGGRMLNYLKALLEKPATDIVFVGYQAKGTPGREIQQYGPNGGYVILDGQKITINADVHTISGYSAHADQRNLVNFVKRMRIKPKLIRLIHGNQQAQHSLAKALQAVTDSKIECAVDINDH